MSFHVVTKRLGHTEVQELVDETEVEATLADDGEEYAETCVCTLDEHRNAAEAF